LISLLAAANSLIQWWWGVTTSVRWAAGFMAMAGRCAVMLNIPSSKAEHAGFHRSAADVIRTQIGRRHTSAARAQIAGEFSRRSRRVISLLERMRNGEKNATF
jgi:hypothetical protein